MSAVYMMTMTARVERATAEQGVTDTYGHQETSPRVVENAMQCYVYPMQPSDVFDKEKTVLIEMYRLFAPLNADLQFQDEITEIRNRRGLKVWGDVRMRVLRVQTWASSHLTALLEQIQ